MDVGSYDFSAHKNTSLWLAAGGHYTLIEVEKEVAALKTFNAYSCGRRSI
jgi:hypothetical protein